MTLPRSIRRLRAARRLTDASAVMAGVFITAAILAALGFQP